MVVAFFDRVSTGYGVVSTIAKALSINLFLATAAFADPVTLLAVGDSLTQGYGLPPEDGFVPQLEGWLRDHGADVVVINAGVSGDTTAGGAARIDWSLTAEVDAVMVALGGNDMLRGIAPAAVHVNLDTILSTITAQALPVLLVGTEASGNFGTDYKIAFDAVFPALAETHGVELFANFLQGLAELDDRDKVMREYIQRDGLHPNAAGVALIVERIGPEVLTLIGKGN